MMRNSIITLSLALLISSCISNNKPRIAHSDNEKSEVTDIAKDTSKIAMADLPVHIDSTFYLLHPVGKFKIKDERGKIIFKSSGYGGNKFSISSSGSYSISGDLSNIMFQHLSSEKLKPLTNSTIKIQAASFLWEVHKKTKQEFLVYEVNDQDTNQDEKLDRNDIKALYLSKIDGSGFKKLTASNRELIDWKVITVINRLYFKTVEDTNKDGDFDENDKVFYKYVDLNLPITTVVEYNPL